MRHALSCAASKLKCNSSNAVVIQRDFPGLHFRKKARQKNLRDDYQNSMRNLSHLRLQANNVSIRELQRNYINVRSVKDPSCLPSAS